MALQKPTFPHGTRVSVKLNGMLVEATYHGWNERYQMPDVKLADGKIVPRKIYGTVQAPEAPLPGLVVTAPDSPAAVAETQVIAPAVVATPAVTANQKFPINQRFTFLEQLIDMVIVGGSNSLIVTGPGGLGKTFTVTNRLTMAGLKEDDDYAIIRGYSTPKSLYRALYENQEKLVVFDDCDSVLEHATSLNILKGALDSYALRNISWLTERSDESLPDSFDFRGSIIFISNKEINEIAQPILSRALFVDLAMTAAEKIERMGAILGFLRTDVPMKHKEESLEHLSTHKDRVSDLNIRTLLKVVEIRVSRPDDWKNLAEYVITAA